MKKARVDADLPCDALMTVFTYLDEIDHHFAEPFVCKQFNDCLKHKYLLNSSGDEDFDKISQSNSNSIWYNLLRSHLSVFSCVTNLHFFDFHKLYCSMFFIPKPAYAHVHEVEKLYKKYRNVVNSLESLIQSTVFNTDFESALKKLQKKQKQFHKSISKLRTTTKRYLYTKNQTKLNGLYGFLSFFKSTKQVYKNEDLGKFDRYGYATYTANSSIWLLSPINGTRIEIELEMSVLYNGSEYKYDFREIEFEESCISFVGRWGEYVDYDDFWYGPDMIPALWKALCHMGFDTLVSTIEEKKNLMQEFWDMIAKDITGFERAFKLTDLYKLDLDGHKLEDLLKPLPSLCY